MKIRSVKGTPTLIKTIGDLMIGEVGYITEWAVKKLSGSVPVSDAPQGTHDVKITKVSDDEVDIEYLNGFIE